MCPQPKVSVIIPVYNTEEYLQECLDSIVNQTLKEIEIICVDDGSTDQSLQILHNYATQDQRFTILTQTNQFAGVARNHGMEQAQGKYLYFMDSDDWIEPNALQMAYDLAEKEVADIVVFNYRNIKNNPFQTTFNQITVSPTCTNGYRETAFQMGSVVWDKLYLHQFIQNEHIFFDDIRICNDVFFAYWSMIRASKVAVLHEFLYNYRTESNGAISRTRMDYIYCVPQVYTHLKMRLKQTNQFRRYQTAFYLAYGSSVKYYLRNCRNQQQKQALCNHITWQDLWLIRWISIKSQIFSELTKISMRLFHFGQSDHNLKCKKHIIVSLTSYPARINTVHYSIKTLLNQDLRADKVILWLASEQFPNREKDLPSELLKLTTQGLTIDWHHDIKSYLKLIPALKKYPNDIIITADDDALYARDWLKKLYNSYLQEPDAIHCHRVHRITLDGCKVLPYEQWQQWQNNSNSFFDHHAIYAHFLTGIGGVLYPPYCLALNVFNEEIFMKICPTADDVWFWSQAVLAKTKIKLVRHALGHPKTIDGTQDTALMQINVGLHQNDQQIANVLEAYPKVLTRLYAEYVEYRHNLYNPFYYLSKLRFFSVVKTDSHKIFYLFGIKVFRKARKNRLKP